MKYYKINFKLQTRRLDLTIYASLFGEIRQKGYVITPEVIVCVIQFIHLWIHLDTKVAGFECCLRKLYWKHPFKPFYHFYF